MNNRNLHNLLIRFLEKILEKSSILSRLYILFFTNMTIKEFSLPSIPEEAEVMVIGCGSIPHTVIILSKEKKWNITAIDKDSKAVKKAKSMIKKYSLSNRIEIKEGDGLNVDLSGYDLIVMAHDVEPKKKMLERIIKEIDEDTFIMFRTTWDLLNFIYTKEDIPKMVNVVKKFKRIDFIKTLLLKKM